MCSEVDVPGLQISVDHAGRVGRDEALQHVVDDRADLRERQVLLALQAIRERLPVQPLEHEQVRALVVRGHLEELAHVRALDRAGDLGLPLEAAHEIRLHRRAGEQDLDRHLAPGLVADGRPDLPHSTPAEQASHSVTCKNIARVDRHVTWIGTVP
jgi:hypothetical protein